MWCEYSKGLGVSIHCGHCHNTTSIYIKQSCIYGKLLSRAKTSSSRSIYESIDRVWTLCWPKSYPTISNNSVYPTADNVIVVNKTLESWTTNWAPLRKLPSIKLFYAWNLSFYVRHPQLQAFRRLRRSRLSCPPPTHNTFHIILPVPPYENNFSYWYIPIQVSKLLNNPTTYEVIYQVGIHAYFKTPVLLLLNDSRGNKTPWLQQVVLSYDIWPPTPCIIIGWAGDDVGRGRGM